MAWWVDNKTAPLVKPRKSPVFSKEMRYFTDEIGKEPTVPQAEWFNMIQGEIVQMAISLGVTPDKLDDGQIGIALGKALAKIASDISKLPKILDVLGDSKIDGASQRIVNVVNKLAKDAQTAANLANDKANQAKQEAYDAKTLVESKQDKLNITGDTGNILGRGAYGLAKKFEKDVDWSAYVSVMGSHDVFLDSVVSHSISQPNSYGFPLQLSNFANLGVQFLFPYRHHDPLVWRSNYGGEWKYAHALTSTNTINQSGFMRDVTAGIAKSDGYKSPTRTANVKYTNTSSKVLRVQIGTYHVSQGGSGLAVNGIVVSQEGASIGAGNNNNLKATLIADVDPGSQYELLIFSGDVKVEFWREREGLI